MSRTLLDEVGAPLPLTGRYSAQGIVVRAGLELWARDAGVRLVFRDDGSDPRQASRVHEELVARGCRFVLGPYASDYPRILSIETSGDGRSWTTRWNGPTAVRAVVAAEQEPREPPLRFSLANVFARFVRLRQLGSDPKYFWSIAELEIFGR